MDFETEQYSSCVHNKQLVLTDEGVVPSKWVDIRVQKLKAEFELKFVKYFFKSLEKCTQY